MDIVQQMKILSEIDREDDILAKRNKYPVCNANKNSTWWAKYKAKKRSKNKKIFANKTINLPDCWGVVYYIKRTSPVTNDIFYKIGIKNINSTRFNEDYTPIFEIPVKTKEEALAIEKIILTMYEPDRVINNIKNFKGNYGLDDGYTELFIRDVLGDNFNLDKLLKRCKRVVDLEAILYSH